MTRCYFSVILILSTMMVVRGAWTDSILSTKTGFDYVAAAWSSSTTCVIVGNTLVRCRILSNWSCLPYDGMDRNNIKHQTSSRGRRAQS